MSSIDIKQIEENAQKFVSNIEKAIEKINRLPKSEREKLSETKKMVQEHLKLMKNEFGCK